MGHTFCFRQPDFRRCAAGNHAKIDYLDVRVRIEVAEGALIGFVEGGGDLLDAGAGADRNANVERLPFVTQIGGAGRSTIARAGPCVNCRAGWLRRPRPMHIMCRVLRARECV